MARFFFHVQDGRFTPDKEGLDLPTLRDAREHCAQLCASILSKEDRFDDGKDWRITITDASGEVVWTLNFYATG